MVTKTALNTTTSMRGKTEPMTVALVRQRTVHVVPGITLMDMHLGCSLALRLVGFCRPHHAETKTSGFGESLFAKFCPHGTEFPWIEDLAKTNVNVSEK